MRPLYLDDGVLKEVPIGGVVGWETPIGVIRRYAVPPGHIGWIKCDASTHLKADYPILAPHMTSVDNDNFQTPFIPPIGIKLLTYFYIKAKLSNE